MQLKYLYAILFTLIVYASGAQVKGKVVEITKKSDTTVF